MSIVDAIGNTPMIKLDHINPCPKRVTIWGKYEGANPGGSIKDRSALYLINDGIESKKIARNKIVIEATSGNTGIGLAMICASYGLQCLLVTSDACSIERRQLISAYGAGIVLTPGEKGTDGAIWLVKKLVELSPNVYYNPNQFDNPASWKAHYYGTAPEIINQVPRVTHVVSAYGTTGTIMGISKFFRQTMFYCHTKMIAVSPRKSSKIQGLKNLQFQKVPKIFDKRYIDETVFIDDSDAMRMTKRLAREEGLLVGMSSGAAVHIACVLAYEVPERSNIVVILPDRGNNYLSTGVYK